MISRLDERGPMDQGAADMNNAARTRSEQSPNNPEHARTNPEHCPNTVLNKARTNPNKWARVGQEQNTTLRVVVFCSAPTTLLFGVR